VKRRHPLWVWIGRAVFVAVGLALVLYLVRVGLDRADKVASSVGVVFALCALVAPYLLPAPASENEPSTVGSDRAVDTGDAIATDGGYAGTGVQLVGGNRPTHASGTGSARAQGPGSVANTGVRRLGGPR
jgi:hypothetical protein